ncbi:MAG: hypothetical protein CUN56_00585 [Phototrophicales bacterium]|nr:MAG: hypothetical protein CUN56_00585 [Phototrophicales bacterium]
MYLGSTARRLLYRLVRDARVNFGLLSEAFGVSRQALYKHRDRMERSGVIRGYHASVDYGKLGYGALTLVVWSVSAEDSDGAGEAAIERLLYDAAVVESWRTADGGAAVIVAHEDAVAFERWLGERDTSLRSITVDYVAALSGEQDPVRGLFVEV